jgi:glycosyltransferase involved in cell wall biosynthesis
MHRYALVSVVIPTFNRSRAVTKAIASILAQSHSGVQVVVVDDGSTDNTIEVVENVRRTDRRVELFRNQFEKGCAGARNTGMARAQGDYITFLDDDDVYQPEKVAAQCATLARKPDVDVVVSGARREWCEVQQDCGWLPIEFRPNRLFDGCFIMSRRRALDGLLLRCNYMEWRDLAFQLHSRGSVVHLSPERLVTKNGTSGSLSRQKERMASVALQNAQLYFEESRGTPVHVVFRSYLANCYKNTANWSLKQGRIGRACVEYTKAFQFQPQLRSLFPFVSMR